VGAAHCVLDANLISLSTVRRNLQANSSAPLE